MQRLYHPRWMLLFRAIHLCGLLLFIISFFLRTVPSEMVTFEGKEVARWAYGTTTHMDLLVDPIENLLSYVLAKAFPGNYGAGQGGDGYERYLHDHFWGLWRSLPISLGWSAALGSAVLAPLLWCRSLTDSLLRYAMGLGALLMLVATPLLALDFYRAATVHAGYFHLGAGAYLIPVAYLLTGSGILLMLAGPVTRHPSELGPNTPAT